MTMETSEVIASLSLLVSFVSAIFAWKSSSAANGAAKANLKLQNGMIELEIRQAIENAKAKVNDIAVIMAPFVSQKQSETITVENAITLDSYKKSFEAAIQTLINTYDDACSKYVDEKLDKERFKKNYRNEIRNLVENKELQEHFHPITSSYKPILNVYKEWESLE